MSFAKMEIDSGDEKFLKIKAGDVVQFHILSQDPIKTVSHWINKKKFDCEGKICEYCAQGDKPKKGWKIKVWDRKSLTVKDYEFGPQVAGQIKNIAEMLAENQQTVDDVDFRIKREGADLETEYFVTQAPNREPVPSSARQAADLPF